MGVPRLVLFAQAAHWHWCMPVNASHCCLAQHVLYDVECALCIYNRVTCLCGLTVTTQTVALVCALCWHSVSYSVLSLLLPRLLYCLIHCTPLAQLLRPHRISLLFWATTLSWCKVGLLLSSFSSTCPANHSCQALHNLDHCIYGHLGRKRPWLQNHIFLEGPHFIEWTTLTFLIDSPQMVVLYPSLICTCTTFLATPNSENVCCG